MKLLNYNELKTLLLEERDKIPLTVPGARYEMNIPQPNKHGESMRGGIRIALRCMERCQPFSIDFATGSTFDDGECRMFHCSVCGYGVDDIFISDEHNHLRDTGPLFNFCPWCGRMVMEVEYETD